MTSIESTRDDGHHEHAAFTEALHACRGAVRPCPDALTSMAALRPAVRDLCHAARHAGIAPERVIVDLKRILRDESKLSPEHADAVREQIVALAIAEYYSDRSPS